MSMNRRTFIRQVTFTMGSATMCFWLETKNAWAQGGPECTLPSDTATPWVIDEPKVRKRFSTKEMGEPAHAAALAKYRDAICKIQALPANDVIGWDKQVAQHCLSCAPSNANNIHFSQYFLPWHRAFLYSFERILRKLSGDDDLRLMYWDWEQDRTVPAIYKAPHQCLLYQNRGFQGLTTSDVDVKPLLAISSWLHFGGGNSGQTGAAFGGPHANVHDAFTGDMSDLQFSPRDPIFYAHHGNIDRLWSSWVNAGHTNPDFGQDKVHFYDENRKFRSLLLNDLRDEKKLGYEYSSLMVAKKHHKTTLQVPFDHSTAHSTVEVMSAISEPRQSHVLLIHDIKGLEKLPEDAHTFGIFSDEDPPVGTLVEKDPAFLGKVATVKAGGKSLKGPLTAALDITPNLARMLNKDKNSTKLTVAPIDRVSGKTTAAAIPLEADDIALEEQVE